jgi:hypothetical protein
MNFTNYFMTKPTDRESDQTPMPKITTEQLDFCGQSPEPQAPTTRDFPYNRLPRSYPPEIITHFEETGEQSPPPPPPSTTRFPPIPTRLPPIPLSSIFGSTSLPSGSDILSVPPVTPFDGPFVFENVKKGNPPKMPLSLPLPEIPERYPKFVRF